jgi:hypothetical protein
MIDKLHLIKFLLLNTLKIVHENKYYIEETFVAVFLHFLKCRSRTQIEELWKAILHVFGWKSRNETSQQLIEDISLGKYHLKDYQYLTEMEGPTVTTEYDYLCKKPIKKESKFYRYFKEILEESIVEENVEGEPNRFYCPKLEYFVLENYLALSPMISLYHVI